MKDLTPQQIVRELDRYIVGQHEAKRAVAIALRNRYRRLALPAEMQAEITPKNILMIGPTGVGKTEIARRLAKLADAPFIKVEATKFTQVGYVGRDAESIVRDLMETAVGMVHDERAAEVREQAAKMAEDRIFEILAQGRRWPAAAARRGRGRREWPRVAGGGDRLRPQAARRRTAQRSTRRSVPPSAQAAGAPNRRRAARPQRA